MDPRNEAWNLIESGHYEQAARRIARQLAEGTQVALGDFGNKAVAELAAGQPLAAERTLEDGQAFAERDCLSRGSNLLLELSEVQWLNGHVEEAVSSLTSRIRGLRNGSVQFVDAGGGCEDGLILYYYGVRLGRASAMGGRNSVAAAGAKAAPVSSERVARSFGSLVLWRLG